MLVSLYTVRVVLNTLGAEDYGIYNLVAGVVVMFGFLSGSMAAASQRYFSFELGRGNFEQLKRLFNMSLFIYTIKVIIVLILSETIGLWFVKYKLAIPSERTAFALLVYQLSIISFEITILKIPYQALVLAHEEMNIYAYLSIIEAVLKLLSAMLLSFIYFDKLLLYASLLCMATMIDIVFYIVICKVKYSECKFDLHWEKKLFLELINYTGLNSLGAFVAAVKFQGINIVLNQFCGPVIITTRNVSSSVSNVVTLFSNNFYNAVRPQIIKNHALGNKSEMQSIVFYSTKIGYFLLYFIVLPLFLELPFVLTLWLKELPQYIVVFTRMALIEVLFNFTSNPYGTVVQATGKIKSYILVTSGITLLCLPCSWITLVMGYPPYFIMIVSIFITFLARIMELFIVSRLADISIKKTFKKIVFPICIVSFVSAIIPAVLFSIMTEGFLRLFVITAASIFSVSGCVYSLGFDKKEHCQVKNFIFYQLIKKPGGYR
jgi:O-antigen/teichoic acid export membrane protein